MSASNIILQEYTPAMEVDGFTALREPFNRLLFANDLGVSSQVRVLWELLRFLDTRDFAHERRINEGTVSIGPGTILDEHDGVFVKAFRMKHSELLSPDAVSSEGFCVKTQTSLACGDTKTQKALFQTHLARCLSRLWDFARLLRRLCPFFLGSSWFTCWSRRLCSVFSGSP